MDKWEDISFWLYNKQINSVLISKYYYLFIFLPRNELVEDSFIYLELQQLN